MFKRSHQREYEKSVGRLLDAVNLVNNILAETRKNGLPLDIWTLECPREDWRKGGWLVVMLF